VLRIECVYGLNVCVLRVGGVIVSECGVLWLCE
jgi:hypothetical protein